MLHIVSRGHSNPSMSRLLNDIRSDVETGTSLNQAFQEVSDVLRCAVLQPVAAGEQAGILETLLDRLATYQEKTIALKGRSRKPCFIPSRLSWSQSGSLGHHDFVIPAFKQVFTSFGADLPTPTLMVIAVSDFMLAYWHVLLFGFAGTLYFLYQSWKRSPRVQMAVDRFMLKPPVIAS